MRWLVLAFLLLPACGPARYSRETMAKADDVAAIRSLGCLDVGLGVRPPLHDDDAALLVVRVGNLCMRPAPFDLSAATVVGTMTDGGTTVVELVDPRDELVPLHVDTGANGVEKVRLRVRDRARDRGELATLCIDLSRTVPSPPAGASVCFVQTGAGWRASR